MNKLWYGADEVRTFHPFVEHCINQALLKSGLEKKYYFKHHYGKFTNGIPDFVILDSSTDDFVCIIEVKKTPSDVFGQDAGKQSMTYVQELYPLRWKFNQFPRFCVTNIEYTQFYSLRSNASVIGCLNENSPKFSASLDSPELQSKFIDVLNEYFLEIHSNSKPSFSMHLESISESFNNSFYDVSEILGANLNRINRLIDADEEVRQSVIYELFRFAFFYYLKEYYNLKKNGIAAHFNEFKAGTNTSSELVFQVKNNFSKVMEIDFIDILKDFKSSKALFPNKILASEDLAKIFNNYILTLKNNASSGISKNSSLMNYVSLISYKIYNKQEMHDKGKIMSDEVLSDILAAFTINDPYDSVVDPCCGDGNLLVSAYKRKKSLITLNNSPNSHNIFLSQLFGIEIDPNLIQLAAFKLIGQNLESVDKNTRTNLTFADIFTINDEKKYDAVIMNPPFLRNEKLGLDNKNLMLRSIENNNAASSFIRKVSQPNLYYFFVEKATFMLKETGSGAFILMSKFLNNQDGELLKKFLIPFLEAVIHYPPSFFKGFAVTTNIFILKNKKIASRKIAFLNVLNTDMLHNIDSLKSIIINNKNEECKDYSVVHVEKEELDPKKNWRLFFIDPSDKFTKLNSIEHLVFIKDLFEIIIRGKAGNSGSSASLFPFSPNNPLKSKANNIEHLYIGYGLLRNSLPSDRRDFILTDECLNSSKGLMLPNNLIDSSNIVDLNILKPGCKRYIEALQLQDNNDKFFQILSDTISSKLVPEIIIPRGDRTKHSIFYYPFKDKPALLSTNFFSLSGLRRTKDKNAENRIKFVTAYLLSSIGQLQFEVHGNSQEGSRKIEKFMIEKFKIIDPEIVTEYQLQKVISDFEELNSLHNDFLGNETTSPRDNLDYSICQILFEKDSMGFKSAIEMKNYFQFFLKDLVNNRLNYEHN
jgi:type I restriction-modification system DNA methylase subunit